MRIAQACQLIAQARGERVIVSTMGAMHTLDALGVSERRLSSVPLMGGAASLGLGLALARPDVGVVVVDGDASLLMQLGGLVTVAEARPQRFLHIVIENGVQFGGASNLPTPGAGKVNYAALAQAAGYAGAMIFDQAEAFAGALPELLEKNGPMLVALKIEPEPSRFGPAQPQPEMPDRQFARMGQEAQALGIWYASHRKDPS
ncbi:Thiamine pyrophosphate enzyme, C-terminal TPP binding domain-containing protein 11 [Cupriavidus necator]|uniref:Thiamine pyrophosphate enzyme, C-terminal TPP binding domain-containing protein 11 n=1 Tax=Cupriavidus necator TaxID=106590 RepID=A0A1K0JGK5_CUPNE|nr:Thiamine pyrophosphate enzyme, C-terminal TPP binding domain-containing protein 11 [Cupriavidus necator]